MVESLKLFPTGVEGLDAVTCGGLIVGSTYMVQGRPGSGKTILANQIAFRHAAAGGRVLLPWARPARAGVLDPEDPRQRLRRDLARPRNRPPGRAPDDGFDPVGAEALKGRDLAYPGIKTVLIVDDEFLILDVIEGALEDAGYRVLRASNGRKALAALQTERPDLIVTDFMMPLMNGQELAAAVRSDPTRITLPIILLSGAQGFVARDRPELFDAVFDKPFDVDKLLQAVARLLREG